MPQTPIYGLPFEQASDQPGITLTGGEFGLEEILAEEVEDELQRIDGETTDLEDRVTEIENQGVLGWTYITHGTGSGATITLDATDGGRFSVGTFGMLRLSGRFDLDTTGEIFMRLNGDTSTIYRSGSLTFSSGGVVVTNRASATLGSWSIAHGATLSTNNFITTIFHTNTNELNNYQSTSTRQSNTASTHDWTNHWGSLSATGVGPIAELNLLATAGASSMVELHWWLEGFKLP